MRTPTYKKQSKYFDIPWYIIDEKHIDFLISAYERVQHNRVNVDLTILLIAIDDYWNYPPYSKKKYLIKAAKLYGYISKQNRFIERVCNQTILDYPWLFTPGVELEQIDDKIERLQGIKENGKRYYNL